MENERGSECRMIIDSIDALSSDSEKEISSTIAATEQYLNGLLKDKQHFKRAYVAICVKLFQVTCRLPYQSISWIIYIGVASDVINALCASLATSSTQGGHLIQQLIKNYCVSRLKDMLWDEQRVDTEALNNLINIPQLLSNRLQLELEEYFVPEMFYTTLMSAVCDVLLKCHVAISTGSHDYSLNHMGYLISKIVTSGYHGAGDHLIGYLDVATSKDMIWQRIACTLVGHLSVTAIDVFVEHVLLKTKPSLLSSSGTCRILGNSLQTQRRLSHILCHKSLLTRCYTKPWLLYNIAGYLRSLSLGQQLMQEALVSLLKVWSDVSLVRHLDYTHLLHISRAIVLFTSCLSDDGFLSSEVCSDMFCQLMRGMEYHMTNPIIDQRSIAMRLAECVSKRIIKDGSPLKFEIKETDETDLLANMAMPIPEQETQLYNFCQSADHVIQSVDNVVPSIDHVTGSKVTNLVQVVANNDGDDDDDDDLIPFNDTPKHNIPYYLREAISGILEGSPNEQLNLVKAMPNLIKSHPHDLDEVCEELCKVLLHCAANDESKQVTKVALVTLLCNCPVKVVTYLIEQFLHHHGYSIEQRLFILELLSDSSLQLSSSHDTEGANQFIPVSGHFFYPLMKYFQQKEKDELIVAHVIHTLAHMIHCAALATESNRMCEHLLELLLEHRSHSSAFVRQSTLCGFVIIMSTSPPTDHPVTALVDWLQDVIDSDSDQHCRSLATEAIKLL